MTLKRCYAHSLPGESEEKWQQLDTHLKNTAALARKFAQDFDSGDWGYPAGLWHDLGKYSDAFQAKLLSRMSDQGNLKATNRVDHSTAGALYAVERFEIAGRILAYIIAGHHAGLADWQADHSGRSALSNRLTQTELLENARNASIPDHILKHDFPSQNPLGRDPALWIRMLFACVVDADFLDTEQFYDQKQAVLRGNYPLLSHQ